MSQKVSILVPIYNVSSYIEKCARSLFNQTFNEIEYIFVNDATQDDSIIKLIKVIEEFPNRKEHIRIIHHEKNKGLAATRNTAIDSANGTYVSIVDSDDYIEPEMIEEMYLAAINQNADIVVSDLLFEYRNHSYRLLDYLSEDKNEQLRDLIKNENSQSYLCNKLFRMELLSHPQCRVPIGLNYLEDRHAIIRMFFYAENIIKVDKAFYHYVQYNPNAITKNKSRMHFENTILFWNLLDTFLTEHNEYEKHRQIIELSKIQCKLQLMMDTQSSELRKEYYSIFRNIEWKYISEFRKGEKIMLLLVRYQLFYCAIFFHFLLVFKNRNHRNKYFTLKK